jgi:hypothetical protein
MDPAQAQLPPKIRHKRLASEAQNEQQPGAHPAPAPADVGAVQWLAQDEGTEKPSKNIK